MLKHASRGVTNDCIEKCQDAENGVCKRRGDASQERGRERVYFSQRQMWTPATGIKKPNHSLFRRTLFTHSLSVKTISFQAQHPPICSLSMSHAIIKLTLSLPIALTSRQRTRACVCVQPQRHLCVLLTKLIHLLFKNGWLIWLFFTYY